MSSQIHTIYILQLSHDCVYVGRTQKNRLQLRYYEHQNGRGAAWTQMHPPMKILGTQDSKDPLDEDVVVIKSMRRWGIGSVRGGSFSNPTLTGAQIEILNRQLNHANGGCIRCGSQTHWIKDCILPARKEREEEAPPPRAVDSSKRRSDGDPPCVRCGRYSHLASDCFAKTHLNGKCLEEEEEDTMSGSENDGVVCFRCGRDGHLSPACYATRHIKTGLVITSPPLLPPWLQGLEYKKRVVEKKKGR